MHEFKMYIGYKKIILALTTSLIDKTEIHCRIIACHSRMKEGVLNLKRFGLAKICRNIKGVVLTRLDCIGMGSVLAGLASGSVSNYSNPSMDSS